MFQNWQRKRAERKLFSNASRGQVFDWIYDTNKWGSDESISGKGSELDRTEAIRSWFPQLLAELGVKSMLDLPCGDLNWLEHIDLSVRYVGADIVGPLILRNRARYPEREFHVLDACHDPLPSVDMILMRDLLVHLCFADIELVLENIRHSSACYLACTTYPGVETNEDKMTGKHHRLNMSLPPFNWPVPLILRDEEERHGKALGVWDIQTLGA